MIIPKLGGVGLGDVVQWVEAWIQRYQQEQEREIGRSSGSGVGSGSGSGSTFPTGTPLPYLGLTAPSGFVFLEGQLLDQVTDAGLYRILGTRWNTGGEPVGSFRLPDARGRFFMSSDDLYGGTGDFVLTQANLPDVELVVTDPGHSHEFTGTPHNHTLNDPGHGHDVGTALVGTAVSVTSGGTPVAGGTNTTLVAQLATTGITANSATAGGTNSDEVTGIVVETGGSSTPVPVLPPFFGGKWMIAR